MTDPSTSSRPPRFRVANRPALVVALVGLGLAGLLYPTVFDPLFALQAMDRDFAHLLWRASQATAGLGVLVGILALFTRSSALAGLYLAGLLLLGAELSFRAWLGHLAPEDFAEQHLARVPERQGGAQDAEHADHPFVQYTAMPFSSSRGTNGYGFKGPDWQLEKAPGTLRVALLGASTTEWGLGDTLPRQLALASDGAAPQAEVLNFGLAGWTSAHSAVNFMLTVQDFQPDAVVVHHGWNDAEMEEGLCPRGDYSSRLSTHPQMLAPVPNRLLLRTSALLRLAMAGGSAAAGRDCCGDLDHSPFTQLNRVGPAEGRSCGGSVFEQRGRLWPYERNLRSIVALARAAGIQAFVLTMPRTEDRSKDRVTQAGIAQIDAANIVNRRVAQETDAILVDLAAELSGRDELFGDLAHMTPEGNELKDSLLATALAAWLQERSAAGD